MLNLKQQEVIEKLLEDIHGQFPEVEYLYTNPVPEDPNELWIHVTAPEDEEREFADRIQFGQSHGHPARLWLSHARLPNLETERRKSAE